MARIVFTLEDGTEIVTELDSDVITLGRHPDSDVVLPSISVSSHHATIKRRGEDFYIQDLGATNGTKLNGVEVEEAKLSNGDRVTLGDVPSVFYLSNAPVHKPSPVKPTAPPIAQVGKPELVAATPAAPAKPGKPPPRVAPGRSHIPSQYNEGIGCASFFMMVIFLALAFIVGLCLRHYNETKGGFLPVDLIKRVQQGENSAK